MTTNKLSPALPANGRPRCRDLPRVATSGWCDACHEERGQCIGPPLTLSGSACGAGLRSVMGLCERPGVFEYEGLCWQHRKRTDAEWAAIKAARMAENREPPESPDRPERSFPTGAVTRCRQDFHTAAVKRKDHMKSLGDWALRYGPELLAVAEAAEAARANKYEADYAFKLNAALHALGKAS